MSAVTESGKSGKPRLGADFGKLWTGVTVSNLGDGVALAAGPLVVAALTDDPRLVAGAVFAQQLPWLLFALVSGVWVDRLDRRVLVFVVNVVRAVVVAALAVALWTDLATVWIVYLAFFLVGLGETLVDTASSALVPAVVPPEGLTRANSRLHAAYYVANQFVGPPLGAALFVVGAALPFGVNAAAFLVTAVLVLALRYRPAARPEHEERALWREVGVGLRWLWGHRLLRTLAVCLCVMNVLLMAAFAILVLYARDRLGLGEVGFGLLLTAGAVGGLLGTAVVEPLRRRFGRHTLLRVGLVVETVTHLALALTDQPWVAALVLFTFGVHGAVWGVLVVTIRQQVIPDALRGRVDSVYRLLVIGGAAVGAPLSGVLAVWLGITAPFWIAGAAMAVLTVVVWGQLDRAAFAAVSPAHR